MLGLLLIMYDLIWLPMQVFEPVEDNFFFVLGLVSSLYWSLGCTIPRGMCGQVLVCGAGGCFDYVCLLSWGVVSSLEWQ